MIASAIISGANPIPIKWGPRADVDLSHAAYRRVRACRLTRWRTVFPWEGAKLDRGSAQVLKGSDGSSLATRW